MNHLAHIRLADPNAGLIVGGFLGDFVKGRLPSTYPPHIDRGIRLHRAIDGFTDQHPIVKRSQQRMGPALRRFAPVISDVVYDHFLARHWQTFHPTALPEYCAHIYLLIKAFDAQLPANINSLIKRMEYHKSLENYAQPEAVEKVLGHLSKRLTRENPMLEGFAGFIAHYAALEADFLAFFPDILDFSSNWQDQHR
ncbi:MAG: acyl carrier protein phosphodiesterase [Candidatus Pseudothioglobus sp.]